MDLERLFQKSFSVAKRVRNETEIGLHAVSVAFAACAMVQQIFENSWLEVTVLLMGAGETIELVATCHLRGNKVKQLLIANRTRDGHSGLRKRLALTSSVWQKLIANLAEADIIITSTAKHPTDYR